MAILPIHKNLRAMARKLKNAFLQLINLLNYLNDPWR